MFHKLLVGLILMILFQGCSSSALSTRMAIPLVENQVASINEETDLTLAEQAIPANLKMLEGMLREDPENEILLKNLAEGFCNYAFSFVEDNDPKRASRLYLRGRSYAERILVAAGAPENLTRQNLEQFINSLKTLSADQLPGLYLLGQCWGSWLMLNLDDLNAFVGISKLEAVIQRALELDETYYYAGPHLLAGAFYGGRTKMLGGNPAKARGHFEKCLELTQHKFLIAHVLYAKTYAVQSQNRELFKKLLNQVMDAPADILPEQQLANTVAKQKARKLLELTDELF